jgi:DNA-damage-inducible protein D
MSEEFERTHGLDIPMEEAIERFVTASHEEASGEETAGRSLIPEGEQASDTFHKAPIRKVFHSGEWWFSVVDVVAALTDSSRPRKYWSDLKTQLIEKEAFSELSGKIGQLPLPGADGKLYPTDVATTETVFRIIQSIPSPKAEPFKRWLARVGYERILEIQNPEIAIKRAIFSYQLDGRSDDWIEKRIRTIVARKELTSEWKKRGVKEGKEYAYLTSIISTGTFGGVTVEGHRRVKGLAKHHNLRDHMTDLELIFTMLGEKSTTEIARTRDAQGFYQNSKAAEAGGKVAGTARLQLEKETGEKVVSSSNYLSVNQRIADPLKLTAKGR